MGNGDKAGAWIIAMEAGSLTAVIERVKPESAAAGQPSFRCQAASSSCPSRASLMRWLAVVAWPSMQLA
jgi:hypothetical protein